MKLGAPSIERLLLDGWETTKAYRRQSALSFFHVCFYEKTNYAFPITFASVAPISAGETTT
jgi:hypothetical protein